MLEFVIGCFLGFVCGKNFRVETQQDVVEKWKHVLQYSSSAGSTPIHESDWKLVANLFEQAEDFCKRNPNESMNYWIIDIREKYKNKTYLFN